MAKSDPKLVKAEQRVRANAAALRDQQRKIEKSLKQQKGDSA